MALKRYTKAIDSTIPVPALLYADERLFTSQFGVGIYDGQYKAMNHQSGTIHVSSHRLFFTDNQTNSFALDLSLITQTEYYAGLFTSSPKVTLHLDSETPPSDNDEADSWVCHVCGQRNRRGATLSVSRVCTLCGVQRQSEPSKPSTPVPPETDGFACPACTFINDRSRSSCEICTTELPIPLAPEASLIKLSFRKGGDKALYSVLKACLKTKAWETETHINDPLPSGSGISGIMQTVESSNQGLESNMKDALHDLEALMLKAKDMVKLAADLNERLTASSANNSSEPEEATFIRSSLSQLGLQMDNAPVTLDMMRDEREWMNQLARELALVLQTVMKGRGIIALDEVWGGWNRARGVALIPPSTFLQVLPNLPQVTVPTIQSRRLPSGLTVLHTPPYSHVAFSARLSGYLTLNGPKTTADIAKEEEITIALAEGMVDAVEQDGQVCRDDPTCAIKEGQIVGGVIQWWPCALFNGYIYDGQQ
ncbi:EAP30/Vps36 family-domain-containing protein [Mucidula mucida]|nr:EAP30/Vps36 family-domain-containing protein [Mucidula mucida]